MRAGALFGICLTGCSLLCNTNLAQPCDEGACLEGYVCIDGRCQRSDGGEPEAGDGGADGGLDCVAPATLCADAGAYCADLSVDPDNCAACSHACGPSNVCQGGTCAFQCDSPGLTCATDGGPVCVQRDTDPDNCGGCGIRCGFQLGCAAGACVACGAAGQPCCRGNECGGLLGCQANLCATVQGTLAAGALHTCALNDGGVVCFGANAFGQLGNGATRNTSQGQQVLGLDAGLVSVAAGAFESCGLDVGGGIWCWGSQAVSSAALQPVLAPARLTAQPVLTPEPLQNLSVGYSHDCVVAGSGSLYCWGAESEGELGLLLPDGGMTAAEVLPTAVSFPAAFAARVTCGQTSTCVLDTAGRVACFGDGSGGELGVADAPSTATPTTVLATSQVSLGSGEPDELYCSVQSDGTLACWGSETACGAADGGLTCYPTGLSTSIAPPATLALPALDTAVLVATSLTHACALGASGVVYCFGENVYGELGDGTTMPSATAVQALVPEAAIDLSVGFTHSCARGKSGAIYCWGSNSDGQLGQDPAALPFSATPVLTQ